RTVHVSTGYPLTLFSLTCACCKPLLNMSKLFYSGLSFLWLVVFVQSQAIGQPSELTREFISPVRVLWQSGNIANIEQLLKPGNGQADLTNASICVLKNEGETKSSILLDFGKELQGGLEIVTGMWSPGNTPRNIRVRYGESASEAMAEIGEKGATNDHAIRDFQFQL